MLTQEENMQLLSFKESYMDTILCVDLSNELKEASDKFKSIVVLAYQGYSDREIANILSVSRQYVNRVKKKLKYRYLK